MSNKAFSSFFAIFDDFSKFLSTFGMLDSKKSSNMEILFNVPSTHFSTILQLRVLDTRVSGNCVPPLVQFVHIEYDENFMLQKLKSNVRGS